MPITLLNKAQSNNLIEM